MILPSKPKKPDLRAALLRRVEALLRAEPPALGIRLPLDHASGLYLFCPLSLVLSVLQDTGRASIRQRRLPAHHVAYFVIACSLWRDKSLPDVWQQMHRLSEEPEPDGSAFSHARKRLGVRPLRALFNRLARDAAALPGASWGPWRLLALDGSVWEMPDTEANRETFGSSSNQHGAGSFPQTRVAALCEARTHAIVDFECGPYASSEQALSVPLLGRLAPGCLVLMDRGLSYFRLVEAVLDRGGEVLARVKVSRALPVEEELPDGSYLSRIYPDYNSSRRKEGGVAVRVICYGHDDPARPGCGELTVLITTVLDWRRLDARQAVLLYPWRWEEESALREVKAVMQRGSQPLLRSKTPELVRQEMYGLMLAHYLTRKVMAEAAQAESLEASRLSFTASLAALKQWLAEGGRKGLLKRYALLLRKVAEKQLRPKRPRSYPRAKKAARQKWPMKRAGEPPPVQPAGPFEQAVQIHLPPVPADQSEGGP